MPRGQLRLYLGAAPGVGKTFAMLNEGRRRHDRGTDVVVGFVETHGRARTAEQVGDLEVVARRHAEYRGTTFEEMDTDALIARRPEVALVDELAHTNVPGSPHEKRWKDVEQLLDAGIDVISTLNIQHLESVNDVVERITGVKQRETIPDDVVRRADQIELVDMTPEALRRRMAHGNVYKADRIDAALANYFRPGNLAALRELALLWLADRVDEGLEEYRERNSITEPWETRERVLVAITGAPGTEGLIRRAARMAHRSRGELLGVHVRNDDGLAGDGRSDAVERHRQLLADLGGEYHEVVASDIAAALAELARVENVTQLVLGASRRSRWAELIRGSVINRVIRLSGPIDLHVISQDASDGHHPIRLRGRGFRRGSALTPRRRLTGLAMAALGLPLLTVGLSRVRDDFTLGTVLLLFLLLVVAISAVGGPLLAIATAVVAFLCANYYFAPPLHQWTIEQRENLLALIVFLVVAGVVSTFVDAAARRARDAARARSDAETLARLAANLQHDDPLADLIVFVRSSFGLDGASVLARLEATANDPTPDTGGWRVEASAGSTPPVSPAEATFTLPLGEGVVLALVGGGLTGADRQVLNAFAAQLTAARDRARLSDAAAQATALTEANELRTALLQAVSHDLRTPLASIKASASSLRQHDIEWSAEDEAAFLETIEDETDRLTALVSNLLDMSRLQAGALQPMLQPVNLEDVIPAAIVSLGDRALGVVVDVPETLDPVRADAALLERVVANLVENAMRWSPGDRPARVTAGRVHDRIDVRIIDHGPGIKPANREQIFQPFQRLGDRGGTGVGLGLAVARGFVRAMEGELIIEDTPEGGTTAVVSLAVAATGSGAAS
jgi:two-component system sensor histidine kinase KdpD